MQARNAELAEAERRREALTAELSALRAQQAERDRAHAAEVARTVETFQALAAKALEGAQTKLAESAEQLMTRQREAAGAGLEANRNALAELITPVKETLIKYETRLGEIEVARTEAYGSLKEQLAGVVLGQEERQRCRCQTGNRAAIIWQSGGAVGRGTVPQRAGSRWIG